MYFDRRTHLVFLLKRHVTLIPGKNNVLLLCIEYLGHVIKKKEKNTLVTGTCPRRLTAGHEPPGSEWARALWTAAEATEGMVAAAFSPRALSVSAPKYLWLGCAGRSRDPRAVRRLELTWRVSVV